MAGVVIFLSTRIRDKQGLFCHGGSREILRLLFMVGLVSHAWFGTLLARFGPSRSVRIAKSES